MSSEVVDRGGLKRRYSGILHNTCNENASWETTGNSHVWAGCYIFS